MMPSARPVDFRIFCKVRRLTMPYKQPMFLVVKDETGPSGGANEEAKAPENEENGQQAVIYKPTHVRNG